MHFLKWWNQKLELGKPSDPDAPFCVAIGKQTRVRPAAPEAEMHGHPLQKGTSTRFSILSPQSHIQPFTTPTTATQTLDNLKQL